MKTYNLSINEDGGYIEEKSDSEDALLTSLFLMLSTEKGKYPVFSGDYGVKRDDLYSHGHLYAAAVLKRRIREAIDAFCGDRIGVRAVDIAVNDGKITATASVFKK